MRFFLLSAGLLFAYLASGQTLLRGKVRTTRMEPLAFVSVQVKELQTGTLTREDGTYELKLEPGKYELVFSMVGYKGQMLTLTVGKEPLQQDVILEVDDSRSLDGVVIRGKSRDRAEEIIRHAIRKRDEHLAAPGAYSCSVYIKAVQEDSSTRTRKTKAPVDTARMAEAYLHRMAMAEVALKLDRGSAGEIREERVAVTRIGRADQLYFLRTTEGDFTIYHALIKAPSVSTVPLVSPLSPGAPVAYRFRTVRIEAGQGRKRYVIAFRPRQVSNATLEGEITIADSSWIVLHVRYQLPRYHLPEYDQFGVEQTYTVTPAGVPLLERQVFTYSSKAGRSRSSGATLVRYSDYELNKQFPRGHFGTELSATAGAAYKVDSSFWQQVRPEPLSQKELRFLRYKDSVYRATHTKAYLDSMDRVINRFTWKKGLLTGQQLSNHEKKQVWSLPPLPALYQPFQLGGGRVQPQAIYSREFADKKTLWVSAYLSYGLRNRDLNGSFTLNRMYNPFSRGFYSIRLERDFQYIFEGDAWINMLKRSNIYLNNGVGIGHGLELANGLFLNSDIDVAFRSSVSDYKTNPEFDSLMKDVLVNNQAVPFEGYNAFYGKLRLSYTPKQRYLREPSEKVILGSAWPTFYVQWRKGIPGPFRSRVDFDYLEFGMHQSIQMGTLGVSNYTIKSGSFLQKRDLRLVDYQFQRRGDPWLFLNPNEAFQSLDSTFAVFRRFYQGHYVHEFNGALLNRIPLLKKLQLREVGGAGFLIAKERNLRYAEIFTGVERVFKWPFTPGAKFKLGFYAVGSVANRFRNPVQLKFGLTSWDRRRNRWF